MDQQIKKDIREKRHEEYGEFRANLRSIGHIWGGILQTYLEDPKIGALPEHIVSLMLATFKCHRAAFRKCKEDNYLDASNYLDEAYSAHIDHSLKEEMDNIEDEDEDVEIKVTEHSEIPQSDVTPFPLPSKRSTQVSTINPFQDWNDQCKEGGPITVCHFSRGVGDFISCNNDDCPIKRVWLARQSGETIVIPRGTSNFDDPSVEVQV